MFSDYSFSFLYGIESGIDPIFRMETLYIEVRGDEGYKGRLSRLKSTLEGSGSQVGQVNHLTRSPDVHVAEGQPC